MERRTFLTWATHGLAALFGAAVSIPAIAYLIDARNRKEAAGAFKQVARLSELGVEEPKQVVMSDVRLDAWTVHPNEVLGQVWLVKRDDKTVDVFSSVCPHLGCSISNYNKDKQRFVCPCHNGTFKLSGELVSAADLEKEQGPGAKNPAPRGMFQLKPDENVKLERDPASPDAKPDYFVLVKYQTFEPV